MTDYRARGARLRRRIVTIGALLIVAFTVSAAVNIWRNYRYTLAALDRELGNLSKALAEEAGRTFQEVQILLSEVNRWQEASVPQPGPEEGRTALAQFEVGVPVTVTYVTDPQGSILYASRPLPAEGFPAPDGEVTLLDGRHVLVMSRDPSRAGQFAGRVSALVDLAGFQRFYDAIDLSKGDTIGLLRRDGTLLARRPLLGSVGKQYPELLQAAETYASREDGPALMASPIDGRPRFFALADVRGFPFVVITTREEAVALAAWRETAIHAGIRTALLALLGAALLAVLVRQLTRADDYEETIRGTAALLDLTRDMMFVRDANDVIVYWNRAAEDIYGWSATEAVGRRSHELLKTKFPAPIDQINAELERTGHWEGELVHTRRDGTTITVATRWALRREEGRPKSVLETNNDITARKAAEVEKARLEGELRRSQKMEAIGTLAGGIAHDFNNILGAILGYAELAQRRAGDAGPLREHLDQVMQAGNRGKRLVEHILAFSRSGVGERLPVHVQSVVEETLDLLAASLPPGIRLEKALRGGDAAIVGDATQLHQVAMNLCTNAVQAMPKGGALTVTLDCTDLDEERKLAHGTLPAGSYVRLEVADTGTGIPPTVLERIFDPFFTTKGVGQGTGLGLSLVHGIVADFGGAVDVETHEGAGTTFTVWLPATGDTAVHVAAVARALPHGNGETVMIVDDERPLVNVAEETLAVLGYEPVGFDSSAAALAAFRAEPDRYDAVLTDETMPDVTGTELAREIRRLRPDIPIVLMSGYSGPQLTERARVAGVSDILRKPLVSRDIAEALARVVPARA